MKRSFLGVFILLAFGSFLTVSAKPVDPDKISARVLARRCTAADLSVRPDPDFSDSAMGGQRGANFIVKNVSRSTCTISGRPGIKLLDSRGRIMGRTISAKSGAATAIKAGGTASFEIGYHSCTFIAGATDGRDPKKCKISAKAQIRFYGIQHVYTVTEKIDAEGGIEQFEGWETK